MGFNAPDQSALEKNRDQAEREHNDYWSKNNRKPDGTYFPGFEAGWNKAKELNGEVSDVDQLAKDQGKNEDQWEWTHGFKAGVKACIKAGSN